MEESGTSSARTDTTGSDYFKKVLTFAGTSGYSTVTVKFTTDDGKVFTQSYAEKTKIGEIKSILVDVFAIPVDNMKIQLGEEIVDDDKSLNEFKLDQYNTLELGLFSAKLGRTISAENAYRDFAVPDVITVQVEDSDEEDGYKDVVVEIVDRSIIKPFLGGYVHKENGLEYHNGYSQTGPPKPKVPPENKNHRDTQTYFYRNRLLDTHYARATQMQSEEVYIPNVTDKILTSGPYETADEREKRLDIENKVRTIQRYYRAMRIRRALKILCAEYAKRIRLAQELEEFNILENANRKRRELIAKVFPRTKADFCMLYAMVDRWKRAEIKRICNTYSGPAKITAFYMLLDKEIQMLKAIEKHRKQVKEDMKLARDREFFKIIADPIAWNNHYKTWMEEYKDLYIEMDTLETQQGNEYYKMYLFISDEKSELEDKLQALLNVKLLLHEHNCRLSNELVDLIDRACELMVRNVCRSRLDILIKRVQGLLLKHIKTPECNFGVTNRMLRVREKLMNDDLFYCKRCQKLKSHKAFDIHSRSEALHTCLACAWDDRVMEPWFDSAPYRYMLRLIRREERRKSSPSSIAFIIQDKDIHHIVVKIWHGHSAVSEFQDVYNLRLCRWFRDQNWSPWNCILLTAEEAKSHLEIKKLEEVYDVNFLDRVFNKQALARLEYKNILKLEDHFQEFGEFDTKWNEIKQFIDFVAVNSKTKLELRCH